MSTCVALEKVAGGWYFIHLPQNTSGHRVLEAQAEGPGGMWRVCPYGSAELETFRGSLKACLRFATEVAAGAPWPEVH